MSTRKCEIGAAAMFAISALHPLSILTVVFLAAIPDNQTLIEHAISLARYIFSEENVKRYIYILFVLEFLVLTIISCSYIFKLESVKNYRRLRFTISTVVGAILCVKWPLLVPTILMGAIFSYGSMQDT